MHKLHLGARWQFRIGAYFALLFPFVFVGSFINSFFNISRISSGTITGSALLVSLVYYLVFAIIFILVFGEIYARMAYNRWLYDFTDTNLKVEKGIIWKKYSNVPYERVQNVDIRRGLLARILGFSSVMIQTAGYSGRGRYGHVGAEGYLPAVDPTFAEKIRDFLMHKISKKGGGGL